MENKKIRDIHYLTRGNFVDLRAQAKNNNYKVYYTKHNEMTFTFKKKTFYTFLRNIMKFASFTCSPRMQITII